MMTLYWLTQIGHTESKYVTTNMNLNITASITCDYEGVELIWLIDYLIVYNISYWTKHGSWYSHP